MTAVDLLQKLQGDLLVELSLAIRFQDYDDRRQLAHAILKTAQSDEFYNLERGQSQALAALVDLDYDAADHYALRLLDASASGEFDNGDSLLAAAWARLVRKLAQHALLVSQKKFHAR